MWLMTTLLLLAISALPAWAQIYKCPDGKGGTVFRDRPCSDERTGSDVPVVPPRLSSSSGWHVRGGTDKLTDERSCILVSPEASLFTTHNQRAAVHIAVALTSIGEMVTLVSAQTSARLSFHNEIRGLGLRIDTHPFVPADVKGNQTVLVFLPERSHQIFTQLETGKTAQFRVRFWPYDETFDGEIPLVGFAEGVEALKRCETAAK